MNALENDIKKAIDIIYSNSGYEQMGKYSNLYFNTTENIKDSYCILKGNEKSALLPTSSMDHTLEAMLYGIKDVTCYDWNVLAKYFGKLKLEAFKSLTRDEYISYMYKTLFDKEYFEYFKNNLDDDTYQFWSELYRHFEGKTIVNNLFRRIGIPEKNIKVCDYNYYAAKTLTNTLSFEGYKKIQKRLEQAKISFVDNDLFLLHLLDQSYDFINLTNIYEFINCDAKIKNAIIFIKQINKIIKLLNENGQIIVSYLYKCDNKQLVEMRKLYNRIINLLVTKLYLNSTESLDKLIKEPNLIRIIQRIYVERNYQLIEQGLKYGFETLEIPKTDLGFTSANTDMIVTYKKRVQFK